MPATSKNANKKLIAAIAVVAVFVVFTTAFSYMLLTREAIEVTCYLYDPCGGCNPDVPCKPCEAEVYYRDRYASLLSDAGLSDSVDFTLLNTRHDANRVSYEEKIAQHGISSDVMPVMIIGETVLQGDGAITSEMINTIKTLGIANRLALLARRGHDGDIVTFMQQDAIVYFKSDTCEDCAAALSYFNNRMPDGISGKIRVYDITEDNNSELLHAYSEYYQANPDCLIPAVFVNDLCLIGSEEIIQYFEIFTDETSTFLTEVMTVE